MKSYSIVSIVILSIALLGCKDNATDSNGEGNDIPTIEGWTLVWNDEFDDSSLDTSKWEHENGDGSQYGLTGWGNNERQYYTEREENLRLNDGILEITALNKETAGYDYTSSRIRTKEKGDWTYGLIEAGIKLPFGQGIWPAFWMLPTDNVYGGWPQSGEIDIMEMVGHQPQTVHGTVHYGESWPNNSHKGNSFTLNSGDFSDEFHVFRIIWEENSIKWFMDGEAFYAVTPSTLAPHPWPFDQRFHILLNVAVGGNWPGDPDNTTVFPQTMFVDYVRVYEKN